MKVASCAATLAMAIVASAAHAGPINYGDFSDIPPGAVIYLDVTEDANRHPHPFGPPNITANMLDFDPQGFFARAAGGGSDGVAGELLFGLCAIDGHSLETISIFETGYYSLGGNGTSATRIEYGMSMSVVALEVDGVPLGTPVILPTAQAGGGDDLGQGSDDKTPWELGFDYDVDAALTTAGVQFEYGATKLGIRIENGIAAFSEGDTFAEIRADDFYIDARTAAIPAPGALALLALGAAVCARGRRR